MRSLTLLEPFRALFYAPFYVADARGCFARQGLAVRFETAGTPDSAAARLLAGEAALAWSGPMRPMLLRSRDPSCTLRSFGAVVMRDPFLLVGRAPPPPGFTPADIAGKRVGLVAEVPTPVWCLDDDLRRAGLDPDAAFERRRGPSMAENAAAVLGGRLDLAQLFEPFAAQVEEAGGAVWWAQADRGPTAYTAFYATEAVLAGQRDAMRGMVRGIADALAWMRDATPDAIAEAIASYFPDLAAAQRRRAMARYQALGLWPPNPRFPRAAFDRLGQAMVAAGVMPAIPPYEACVDAAIVEEALTA